MGEMGTLVDVEPGRTGLMLLVTTEYEGRRVTGVLPVRPQLHDQVLQVLQAQRERPLDEVGGTEIPES